MKIVALVIVGVLTIILWILLVLLLDKKCYQLFYKSKYASIDKYEQAVKDKSNKFTPIHYYIFMPIALVLSLFITSEIFAFFSFQSKNVAVEKTVTINEDTQKTTLEDEKKKIEKEKQELEKQKKELEEQKKTAVKEETQKSSPPPQRKSAQSNIPIEISDGRFEYYSEGSLKTLRLKFNVSNVSSKTVYLTMDSFVVKKSGSNAVKPSHFGGGFSDTINNPYYDNRSKDLFSGDTMAVCLDYPVGKLGEGGWFLYYEHINELIKIMSVD